MALAVKHLRPGESLNQRTLKRITREHRDEPIPSYSTVHRQIKERFPGERFTRWCKEAEQHARM
jgi:hypothetical protein